MPAMDSQMPVKAAAQPACQQMRKDMWKAIEARYCAGDSLATLVDAYGVKRDAIIKRSQLDKWPTARRIAKAQDQAVVTSDPASIIADVWRRRGEQSREEVYQGSNKALRRFFAAAPVPQSFKEAAVAEKLLAKALEPDGEKQNKQNKLDVNLAFLLGHITPTPCRVSPIDV